MKTELDFTKVPLDKWVDLFNQIDVAPDVDAQTLRVWRDVKKAAEVQVKEEADLNKEIADAYLVWTSDPNSKEADVAFGKLLDAVAAKKKLMGIEEKPVERENALAPVEDIIK